MSKQSIETVLLIEDNFGDARLLREMFNEQGSHDIELTHVECMSDAEKYLAERAVGIVLLDLGLPDVQGLEAVRRAHAAAPHIPLVVLSGLDDESMAVQALQVGAQDYLIKGQIAPRELLRALRYAIERKIIEETLFAEKERVQVTLDCMGDAVICTDISGNITFLNLVAEKLTGWSLPEAVGRPIAEAFRIVDPTSREPTPNLMERAVEQDRTGHLPLDCILIRRDGFEIHIEDSVGSIHDRQGQLIGVVIVFRDVSAARAMTQQMAYSAQHDFLTGLPNRLLLSDRVSQSIALARRHLCQVAVLFLDLDGFKHINDSLGHSVGDKLLQSIAKRLVDCVRAPDTVSRQGGDEFVVLLQEVQQAEDAAITARRVLQAVAEPHSIDQHDLHVTSSMGVSVYPDDGLDAETLIKNADTAMYQAKENGRQSYQFFRPAMNARAVERHSIEEHLRCALERQELALHQESSTTRLLRTMRSAKGWIKVPAERAAGNCRTYRDLGGYTQSAVTSSKKRHKFHRLGGEVSSEWTNVNDATRELVTGSPSRLAGLNFHCRTLRVASSVSDGMSWTTLIWLIAPEASTLTWSMTVPKAALAAGNTVGAVERTSMGSYCDEGCSWDCACVDSDQGTKGEGVKVKDATTGTATGLPSILAGANFQFIALRSACSVSEGISRIISTRPTFPDVSTSRCRTTVPNAVHVTGYNVSAAETTLGG